MGFVVPPYDGMQNYARMKFLYDSVRRFAPRSDAVALEIGCYKGCSTIFFAKACRRSGIPKVYAMDLFTGTPSWNLKIDVYDTTASRIAAYGLARYVTLLRAHSLAYEWNADIAVMHLDADHEYPAVAADLRRYAPFVVEGGIIIFDDYDTKHPGVVQAVHELLAGGEFEIAAVNYQGPEYGSLCLKRVVRKADGPAANAAS